MEKTVRKHITEWRSSTTRINTKRSSAPHLSTGQGSASMVNIAHSLIQRQRSQSNSLTSLTRTLTSTCSTSSQFGVPIMRVSTRDRFVSMRTTGRTSDANLNSISTQKINAIIGDRDNLLAVTRTGATMNSSASIVTVGKSKSSILITINSTPVDILTLATKFTVPITITTRTSETTCSSGLNCSQNQEWLTSPPTTTCRTSKTSL